MENSKITVKKIIFDDSATNRKIKCSKCGGSGNFKTPENSRRTCLDCFGKGYIYCQWSSKIEFKNIRLLIKSTFY